MRLQEELMRLSQYQVDMLVTQGWSGPETTGDGHSGTWTSGCNSWGHADKQCQTRANISCNGGDGRLIMDTRETRQGEAVDKVLYCI